MACFFDSRCVCLTFILRRLLDLTAAFDTVYYYYYYYY